MEMSEMEIRECFNKGCGVEGIEHALVAIEFYSNQGLSDSPLAA